MHRSTGEGAAIASDATRTAAAAAAPSTRCDSATGVSADLLELGRVPGLLVCSGPKSIVDPVATADLLEELGVAVVGYGVDR
ncbi:MAG: pseudouridine-5'-phosphate glycosidase, partial [Actinomycetota bacterium]